MRTLLVDHAAVEFAERGFINAELFYLTGEIDSAGTGLLGSVSSSYDFDGVAGRVVVGYDVLGGDTISLTPTIGLNAASISFDDASETGGFGFLVQREDADFVEARTVTLSSAQIPTFGAIIPGREQDRFELAAGVAYNVNENFVIEVGYLGDFADGYDAHSGRASVRIAF